MNPEKRTRKEVATFPGDSRDPKKGPRDRAIPA